MIAGAGQLGSRYLQGFSNVREQLNIWVFDVSKKSLEVSRNRWLECNSFTHNVYFIDDLTNLPSFIDLAVISSTADVRLHLLKEIISRSNAKYLILEKILAQTIEDVREFNCILSRCNGAWVNTPMYMWPLYKNLRKYYEGKMSAVHMKVSGIQGLACNAIHYIDYVARWNKSLPVYLDVSGLNRDWFPAKRPGFYEIDGVLKIFFNDKSTLTLTSNKQNNVYKVSVAVGDDLWDVKDKESMATNGASTIEGTIKLQSELSADLYNNIFYAGGPDLPTIKESTLQHEVLLGGLISHWRNYGPADLLKLQIT